MTADAEPTPESEKAAFPSATGNWRRRRDAAVGLFGPLLALACVILFFSVADHVAADGTFATFLNLRTVTVQTCVVAVAALGMTVIIVAGGIDLSAGTALALCATTLAWGLREDIAFRCWHGDNVATASQRLEAAQKRPAQRRTAGGEAAETAGSSHDDEIAARRQRLIAILSVKAEMAQDEAVRQAIRERARRLESPDFRLVVDPRWLEGIPNSPWTPWLAVGLAIATGLATGLVNGLLVSRLKLVPFVVTLGTMTIFLGLGNLLSNNVPVRPSMAQIPTWLADLDGNLPNALWWGFPSGVWCVLVLASLLALVLRYTVFGRYVFALGSNEATARLCGINVPLYKTLFYVLGGLFFGLAGIYQFTRLSQGAPMSGAGLELEIIAAVVIGGGSLQGGRGTVLGTLAGAAMTAVIKSGCTQLGLADPLQRIILGSIIICAVSIDQWRQRRS